MSSASTSSTRHPWARLATLPTALLIIPFVRPLLHLRKLKKRLWWLRCIGPSPVDERFPHVLPSDLLFPGFGWLWLFSKHNLSWPLLSSKSQIASDFPSRPQIAIPHCFVLPQKSLAISVWGGIAIANRKSQKSLWFRCAKAPSRVRPCSLGEGAWCRVHLIAHGPEVDCVMQTSRLSGAQREIQEDLKRILCDQPRCIILEVFRKMVTRTRSIFPVLNVGWDMVVHGTAQVVLVSAHEDWEGQACRVFPTSLFCVIHGPTHKILHWQPQKDCS